MNDPGGHALEALSLEELEAEHSRIGAMISKAKDLRISQIKRELEELQGETTPAVQIKTNCQPRVLLPGVHFSLFSSKNLLILMPFVSVHDENSGRH